MPRFCAAAVVACIFATAPALAGEATPRPHLTLGGFDLGTAERRAELLGGGGLSLGTVSNANTPGHLAMGGYLAYALRDFQLSSSLTGDDAGRGADLSAAYSGSLMGNEGTAALRLGYDWSRPVPFSPNASAPASTLLDAPRQGLSLSLSWRQDLTPGLSLGGFAAAARVPQATPTAPSDDAGPDFRLGAGVGVKF